MGLSLLSPLPDLGQKVRALEQELFNRNRQLEEAQQALRVVEARERVLVSGVNNLREILAPLHRVLGMIFGEIEAAGVSGAAPDGLPKTNAAWEGWKKSLGGKAADAIDVLLVHGELNATQLRIHLQCGRDYVYNVISQLHKAGLLHKNGGKISLKHL